MLRLSIPSRWKVRLVGFLVLIATGFLLRPLSVRSLEQTIPSLSSSDTLSVIATAGAPCRLTNVSYAPGQHAIAGMTGQLLPGGVRVKVENSDGQPVRGVTIAFELITRPKGADDATITPSAISGPDGVASADLRLGDSDGTYLITARTDNMIGVMPRITGNALKPTWWIFLTFGLVGGLGLFLYGMELGSSGLQKIAGNRMRTILAALTTNRFMGLLLGTIVTALVQSSSATTVMVVGFVSAGLMNLIQSLGVIMGANIGTTVTVQLIAFRITDYALLMIGIGFIMTVITKRKMYVYVGEIILGFGMIFYGMAVMSSAMSPLRSMPVFSDTLLSLGDRPLLGIIAAALFTGLVQSSGATIGLAVVLAGEGLLNLSAAMPIVLGANIGTTVTTLLAMVGASVEGKRAGVAHLLFNVLGVAIFFPFLAWYVPTIETLTQWMGSVSVPREVANGHMVFNIAIAFIFLPFLQPLAWLVSRIVPEAEEPEPEVTLRYLNNDLLETPDLALTSAYQEVLRVASTVGSMIRRALSAFASDGETVRNELADQEHQVVVLCDELRKYYIRLSQKDIGLMQSREKQGHMSIMDDLRQMAQLIGEDTMSSAAALSERGTSFSKQGQQELQEYLDFTVQTHDATVEAVRARSINMAQEVRKNKNEGEDFERRLRTAHLARLDAGLPESAATSGAHMDFLTVLRQLGRHHFRICRMLQEFLTPPK